MRQFLGTLAILAIVAGIICYANGWLIFHNNAQSTSVEVKTEEIKDATGRVVEKSKELMQEATTPDKAPDPARRVSPSPEIEAVPSYPITPPAPTQPTTADDLYTQPAQP